MFTKRIASGIAVAAVLVLVASAAPAQVTIDTTGAWDGTANVFPFGPPNTQTYGQVVTAPAGAGALTSFTVRLRAETVGQVVTFRGEVYAWDAGNGRATGPALWESAPVTTSGVVTFETFTFTIPGGVPVTPGNQYVLFGSTSKDTQTPGRTYWGYIEVGVYAGGDFVFINNGTDTARWTTSTWGIYAGDLAFTATFTVAAPTLTAVVPNVGQVTGGTTVTITGTNLSGATSVTFGGVAATITSSTATSVTVTIPAHAEGVVDVVVTTPSGSATLQAAFRYIDGAHVPTLSGWALALMAAAIAAAASFKLRA